ncbi:MAG: 4Fe-4S binding protein [Chloroflexi bacterium]|nr:4Fe-4S binding protein [Chloroflexota bacterium]
MRLEISPEKCTGCQTCVTFCALKHEGVANPELARIHIWEDHSEVSFLPITCVLCDDKPCIAACPELGAIGVNDLGAVVINEDLCTGCSKCVRACQIGAIRLHLLPGRGKSGKAVVLKCDLCDGDPWCVKVCEPEAITIRDDDGGQAMHATLLAELERIPDRRIRPHRGKPTDNSAQGFHYQGYAGQYLRVDLSSGEIQKLPLPVEWAENYLGGNGIGTKILWDEVPASVEPLAPGNKLILATGPLCGSPVPNSGRVEFIGKSPLTGIYGDANAGGHLGPELKMAGYDLVIFEGRSPEPVYLYINDEQVELRPAGHLWGLGTFETETRLRNETNLPQFKTAIIGPAGENLVRYACIQVTSRRSAARSGLGAVMGSKNLKAIAVRGTRGFPISNPELTLDITLKYHRAIRENEFFPGVHKFGTAGLVSLMHFMGRFPTQNHRLGSFEDFIPISAEALHENHFVRDIACNNCPVGCDKVYTVTEGEFAGSMSTSVEYETLNSLGSRICNSNLPALLRGNELCDDLGLDTISAGSAIAFAMELVEKGILKPEDCDGLSLEWGNFHTMLELLERITYRKGYLGDLLAEGAAWAAKKLGGGAERYAMHVKGQDIPAQDGRAQQSMGLAHVTSSRGADHLKAFPVIDETGYPGEAARRYGQERLPEIVDPLAIKHKAFLVKDGEDFGAIVDSCGNCKSGGTFVMPEIYWQEQCNALNAVNGITLSAVELKHIGERIYNLQRCYNALHGIDKSDDVLPWRMTKVPSPSGNAKGSVCHISEMLADYYALRDWDPESGLPNESKLHDLGLGAACLRVREALASGEAQKQRARLGWAAPYTGEVVDSL